MLHPVSGFHAQPPDGCGTQRSKRVSSAGRENGVPTAKLPTDAAGHIRRRDLCPEGGTTDPVFVSRYSEKISNKTGGKSKMKKKSSRIAALVLTLCMVFFGLPVTAMAETASVDTEAALNAAIAAGSSVTLSSSVTTNNQIDVRAENIVLDLNGYTLTTPRINVHAAASLTIKDSSADDEKTSYSGTGKVTSNQPNTYLIVVWPDGTEKAGSLLIESGTIETTSTQNDVIFNGGTVNITGGKIKSQGNAGPIYATSKPSSFGKTSLSEPVVCNVSGDALLETGY